MQANPVRPIRLGTRERVLTTLVIIIVVLVTAGFIVETLRFVVFADGGVPHGGTLMGLFDMDSEDTVPTWFQGLHLALAGFMTLAWCGHSPRHERWGWRVVGALFLLMSMDELISLHESFTGPLAQLLSMENLPWFLGWVVLTMPAAALFGLVMIPFLRRLPKATALRLLAAGVVFVAGAAGMEMVGGAIAEGAGQANYPYRLAMMTEETLEMLGTLLAIRAILMHFQPPALHEDHEGAIARTY